MRLIRWAISFFENHKDVGFVIWVGVVSVWMLRIS